MAASAEGESEYREHLCSNWKAARVEAQRQMSLEPDYRVFEWVAVKNSQGQWVARRVPIGSVQEPKPFWQSFVGALGMLNWFQSVVLAGCGSALGLRRRPSEQPVDDPRGNQRRDPCQDE